MMKSSPTSAFEMPEPDFLLQFEIIAFDAPAKLRHVDEMGECHALIQCREPEFRRRFFVDAFSSSGHSISSHSSGIVRVAASRSCAERTLTRAKRPDNRAFEPSRQVIFRQLLFGRLSASCSTPTGLCASSWTGRTARRPRLEYACGGHAAVPGAFGEDIGHSRASRRAKRATCKSWLGHHSSDQSDGGIGRRIADNQ